MSVEEASIAPPREPTPEQAAAIAVRGRDVLLEAGAGTGKTGVMVERYCRLVCDGGLSPDAILAFTFTEKAAAEMRQRIRAELARRAERGSERAAAALAGIGGAWIATIHGFCNRVLAAHPVAAGVDPGFRVLDTPEAARAARAAFDDALVDFLADGDPAREETVAAYDVDGLRGTVASIHDELRSRGMAEPRLPEPPPADPEPALRRAAEAAEACLAELKEGNGKRELLERALARLRAPGPAPSVEELRALALNTKAKALLPYKEAIEAAIARTAEAGEGGIVYPHLGELLRLFSARFEAAKERRAGIDFEDLQIIATRLLERAEVGEHYRGRFRQILVDEFQDTNRLQLRLIEALRGPQTELVVVGDELQSIYGFRHADLDVFRRRREEIDRRADAELMRLSGNFRSQPELVGAFNLFGGTLLGAAYNPLRVGTEPDGVASSPDTGDDVPPAEESPAVELLLTARDGWDGEGIELEPAIDGATPLNCLAEARFVAARLRELADEGVPRGEMVVLLRAFSHLDAYEDSLERAGLRPYVVGGRGYWSQQQVADVCALLAVVANPLDDHALFGALASPACAVAPDTLWLLRMAAGKRHHVWPAVERAAGAGEAELVEPERLDGIPEDERELLATFVARIASLRARAPRLSLSVLIEAAVTETGYDLAVLSRPAGEARFANVRKMGRLAAEFEAREGRDLRGFLDFLAARAETDVEAQAATAAEGHDGVRIMTVHNAKGLEFGVVAVPDLSRRLLGGGRSPLLVLGREEEPRVGMRLLRLGSPKIDLFDYGALCEESAEREGEEELRLFHVAATRARERLILSGVVAPEPGRETKGRPVVERLVDALGVPRDGDSTVPVAPPSPRPGLDAEFEPSQIAVRVNLPSPERAAELRALRREGAGTRELGEGPPPLVERRPPTVPARPLSYTAISAYEECPYRFYMERVLGLASTERTSSGMAGSAFGSEEATASAREERAARGAVVHALLEWSQANGWREPTAELALRHAIAAGLGAGTPSPDTARQWLAVERLEREFRPPRLAEELLEPVRRWIGSPLREQITAEATRTRAEVPLLLGVGETVLRGSIDLLVEREGAPPLVVDYKTDRLGGANPAERAAQYGVQRSIYALAVAETLRVEEVEVAYVFLERPDEPAVSTLGPVEMAAARASLEATIAHIGQGDFPVAPPEERDWSLCRGCPALRGLCSGPSEG
ncbi:MAG TPA: UvrD-helicase domain-containing protein [Solirubrobacterales bacterium]|nr:UvrD-helicase domain-containing protein [Solirubrobacterales bacterium]